MRLTRRQEKMRQRKKKRKRKKEKESPDMMKETRGTKDRPLWSISLPRGLEL